MAKFIAIYIFFIESNFNITQSISVYPKCKSHHKNIIKPDLKIQVFGHVTTFRWTSSSRHLGHNAFRFRVILLGLLDHKGKDTRFLRNVGKYSLNGRASHLRTPESSAIQL